MISPNNITFFIIICFLLSCCAVEQLNAQTQNVNYTESFDDIINPDRGFYYPINCFASDFIPLNISQLQSLKTNFTPYQGNYQVKTSLILRHYILDSFVNTPSLSTDFLNNLQADFDIARIAGVRLILRFSYTIQPETSCGEAACPPYGDANKSVVLAHINQLAHYWQANEDVIAALQHGFIGVWGENYYTDHFGDASEGFLGQGYLSNQNWQDRIEVLEALLNAMPESRMVQVRYPQLKQKYLYGIDAPVTSPAMQAELAHTAAHAARIGFHNDCFLAAPDDYGTYADYGSDTNPITSDQTTVLKPYAAADGMYVAIGGETCSDADFDPQNNCASQSGQAENDMTFLHYSYLNAEYNNAVNNDWQDGGCMNDIKRQLGYRFVLRNGTFLTNATAGQSIDFSLTIENVGFAAPFNQRTWRLILRHQDSGSEFPLLLQNVTNADTRFWIAGSIHTLSGSTQLPQLMPNGNYDVLLQLSDFSNAGRIANQPDYCIQFANTGTWETPTGYNNLLHSINISSPYTATGPSNCITVDGNAGDWVSIAPLTTNGSGGLSSLKVAEDNNFIYLLIQGTMDEYYNIFIDSDGDTAGTNEFGDTFWASNGFNFLIENGILYNYTGSGNNWSWAYISNVDAVKTASAIELSIPKTSMALSSSTVVNFGVVALDNTWTTTGFMPLAANAATYNIGSSTVCVATPIDAVLNAKVWLQGAYNTGSSNMNVELSNNQILPLWQPYNNIPWLHTSATVVSDIPINATDWLLIELLNTSFEPIATTAAFVDTNGNLLSTDGTLGVGFPYLNNTTMYYLIIRHRNHVDIMSAAPVTLNAAITHNFGMPSNVKGGISQLHDLGNGSYAMLAGDVDGNGTITHNDANAYQINQTMGNNSTYNKADCNLDGDFTPSDFNILQSNTSKIGIIEIRY